MRALSRRNDDPKAASGPFDAEPRRLRDGRGRRRSSCSRSSSTRRRAARRSTPSCSATASPRTRTTSPSPTRPATNPARAMTMAFADAGIDPSEIGYINAHGTSTPVGDASETRVIKLAARRGERAPGSRSPRRRARPATASAPPARSRRSSRSSRSSAASCRRRSTTTTPDPECDLDYIPNEAREAEVEVGVSNSFGFGGHNACIVFRSRSACAKQQTVTGVTACSRDTA